VARGLKLCWLAIATLVGGLVGLTADVQSNGAHVGAPGVRPSFTEEAVTRGAEVTPDPTRDRQGMSVTAGDFDRDGYVDLVTTEWNGKPPAICSGSHARLLHNRGAMAPGHFEDVTEQTRAMMTFGTTGSTTVPLSFSPAFPDLDDDDWPDLAVVADARSSQLFWNDGNGRFTRGTEAAMVGTDEVGGSPTKPT